MLFIRFYFTPFLVMLVRVPARIVKSNMPNETSSTLPRVEMSEDGGGGGYDHHDDRLGCGYDYDDDGGGGGGGS